MAITTLLLDADGVVQCNIGQFARVSASSAGGRRC